MICRNGASLQANSRQLMQNELDQSTESVTLPNGNIINTTMLGSGRMNLHTNNNRLGVSESTNIMYLPGMKSHQEPDFTNVSVLLRHRLCRLHHPPLHRPKLNGTGNLLFNCNLVKTLGQGQKPRQRRRSHRSTRMQLWTMVEAKWDRSSNPVSIWMGVNPLHPLRVCLI